MSDDEFTLVIDTASGVVTRFGIAGTDTADAVGLSWREVLRCDPSPDLLVHAIGTGQRVLLPPFVARVAGKGAYALAGLVAPAGAGATALRLWRLPGLDESNVDPASGDVVAVIGVDQLHYSPDWGAPETTALLRDARGSLADIVRGRDVVGAAGAASVVLLLREVSDVEAADMGRALLSHLHRALLPAHPGAAGARFSLGIAECQGNGLTALVAAHNALSLAQYTGGEETIHIAGERDGERLTGRALTGAMALPGSALSRPEGKRTSATEAALKMQSSARVRETPPVAPLERDIEGYVADNMEGAVDQAMFLARFDMPVAIFGPAGTGKLYIARILHDASGAADDMFQPVDCRELKSRSSAIKRIGQELARGEGRTLVFKSPHLMHPEAQNKLARQVSTRILADVSPRQYLPKMKLVAVFPEPLPVLLRRGQVTEALASAFSGYPIEVPPIRDRKQAVLRWAHKILLQEGAAQDRELRGFTPDAEQAMQNYDWPGNISEMRQCIRDALEKTTRDWLTPVDLGLFKGIDPEGVSVAAQPFLVAAATQEEAERYTPSTIEALDIALGAAVHDLLEHDLVKPLGQWLEDELVTAALERYRGDLSKSAGFLGTRPRNLSRWQPKIAEREEERAASSLWQTPRRLLREWVRETQQPEESPLEQLQDKLMRHLLAQAGALSVAKRAAIMGVSTPTYNKRLRELRPA